MTWTIWRKLMVLSMIGMLTVLLVGWQGYTGMSRINERVNEVMTMTSALRNHMQADMMHDALRADVLGAVVLADAHPEDKTKIQGDIKEHSANFRTMLEANEKLPLPLDIRSALQKVRPDLDRYIKSADDLVTLAFSDRAAAISRLDDLLQAFKKLEPEMAELSDLISTRTQKTQEEADNTRRQALWQLIIVTLLITAFLAVTASLIARRVTVPLNQTITALREIANGEGDLTKKLPIASNDEIGDLARWFNLFTEKLQAILSQVRGAANHVAVASQQLAAASEQLSSGSQEQASALEETAASMEEMTATVKQNAENARQANQLTVGARDVAEKSGAVVTAAVSSMREITTASKKITEISSVIDEIAFQTNLLALNAAVEAARAGEHGRGFAVVAAEVRNLAQRSASAAKEIKSLIQSAGQKVEDGAALVNKSGEALQEIVSGVRHVSDIVSEIAAASHEQAQGIEQVNKTVTQMDSVTQANAAQTEEMSSTTQSLATQAQQLLSLVSRFKLNESSVSAHKDTVMDHDQLMVATRPLVEPTHVARHQRALGSYVNGLDKSASRREDKNNKTSSIDDFEEF